MWSAICISRAEKRASAEFWGFFFPQTSLGKMKIVFGRNMLDSSVYSLTGYKLIFLVLLAP